MKIILAKDFSISPGGRYKKYGPYSGEEFRESILVPKMSEALANNEKLTIDFDNIFGCSTGFLEESFGGLTMYFAKEDILNTLVIIANDDIRIKEDIINYVNNSPRKRVPIRKLTNN